MKQTNYFILTLLCLLTIICFQALLNQPTPQQNYSAQETQLEAKLKEKIDLAAKNPQKVAVLALIVLTYLGIFLAGIVTLAVFSARKAMHLEVLGPTEPTKPFHLNSQQTLQLLFRITLFVLISGILQLFSYIFLTKNNLADITILSNTFMELITIFLISQVLPLPQLILPIKKHQVLRIFALYAAMLPLLLLAASINRAFNAIFKIAPKLNPAIDLALNIKTGQPLLLLIFLVAILAPLAEELLFRGVLFKYLRQRFNFWAAAGLLSLFFALIHKTPQDTLPLFIVSMCLCLIYEKTQNLLSPILFHALFNSVNIFLLLTLKSIL